MQNNLPHFYEKIQGWFDFQGLYTRVVNEALNDSKFVEIGSWRGKSSAYMAVEIKNSSKNISFYCVDTWEGSKEHKKMVCVKHNTLFNEFIANIKPVEDIITPIKMDSLQAALTFEDNSLDFIFIDASHDYKSVKQDLEAWYPKLKPTGVFAGHDYTWGDVKGAVDEFSLNNNLSVEVDNVSWILVKKH